MKLKYFKQVETSLNLALRTNFLCCGPKWSDLEPSIFSDSTFTIEKAVTRRLFQVCVTAYA